MYYTDANKPEQKDYVLKTCMVNRPVVRMGSIGSEELAALTKKWSTTL